MAKLRVKAMPLQHFYKFPSVYWTFCKREFSHVEQKECYTSSVLLSLSDSFREVGVFIHNVQPMKCSITDQGQILFTSATAAFQTQSRKAVTNRKKTSVN